MDDDPSSLDFHASLVREKYPNCQIMTASNGRIALDLMQKNIPELILLDLMMPEMNGEEMLAKLRETPYGHNVKVIILTNMGEQEIPKSIKNLGVEAVILKAHMTPREVEDIVKKELGHKS